jgi:hypothetical protein
MKVVFKVGPLDKMGRAAEEEVLKVVGVVAHTP